MGFPVQALTRPGRLIVVFIVHIVLSPPRPRPSRPGQCATARSHAGPPASVGSAQRGSGERREPSKAARTQPAGRERRETTRAERQAAAATARVRPGLRNPGHSETFRIELLIFGDCLPRAGGGSLGQGGWATLGRPRGRCRAERWSTCSTAFGLVVRFLIGVCAWPTLWALPR